MKNTKLLELITSLSNKELNRLDNYLSTPYINHNVKIYRLFKVLRSNLNNVQITKEFLLSKLFPAETNSRQKLNLLLSGLFKQVNRFLLIEYLRTNPYAENILLLKIYKKRGTKKNYLLALKETINVHNRQKEKDEEYYYEQYRLESFYNRNLIEKIVFKGNNIYSEANENADNFYVCIKLKALIDALNIKREVNPGLDAGIWMQNDIIEKVKANLPYYKKDHSLIYCYYLVLMTIMLKSNEKYYSQLKKYVSSNKIKFTLGSLKNLYSEMKNFCIFKIGADSSSKYVGELLSIYKLSEQYFYSAEKSIRHSDFNGIIIMALSQDEIDYAEYIYNKYKDKINIGPVEDTLLLTKALIEFSKGNYSESLLHIKHVNYNNFNYYIRVKVLLLEIYYETGQEDLISFETDSLKHYLFRHKEKLIKYYKPVSLFLKYYNKAVRASKIKKGFPELYRELKNNKDVFAKKWLMEKISKLGKPY